MSGKLEKLTQAELKDFALICDLELGGAKVVMIFHFCVFIFECSDFFRANW